MYDLDRLRRELCSGLDSKDRADLDLFEIRLDGEWRARRKSSFELFEERPDLMRIELESDLALFEALLDTLAWLELWEFCALLRDRLVAWSSSC